MTTKTTTAQPSSEPNTITVSNAIATGESKIGFGFSHFTAPTPKEAMYALGAYLIINKAFVAWISTTHLVTPETVYEIKNFLMLLLDPVALGLSQMFGIKTPKTKS